MPIRDRDARRKYNREWVARRKAQWLAANGPCVDCGAGEKLEVDHIDPTTKVTHSVWTWSATRRLAELAKCVVRCHRCHKKKTAEENRKRFTRPIRHGSIAAYLQKKCKCDVCREFYRKWRRNKYERIGK